MRYSGKMAGCYPTDDPLEALAVDEAVDSLNDLAVYKEPVRGFYAVWLKTLLFV
jgi:hypothetical protein